MLPRTSAKHTLATLITFALALFAVFAPSLVPAQSTPRIPYRSLRLPNTTFPLHYHFHISTDAQLQELTFNGNATIDVEIRESTNEIVLHAKNLSNFEISVRDLNTDQLFDGLTHSYDSVAHFLIIHPIENYQAFEAGQRFRLEILYVGLIHQNTRGVYRVAYSDANNETMFVLATQFEPTSARLAFPCYDEPAFKTNITMRLTHGSTYTALSNMPVQQMTEHSDGSTTTTTFQTSPVICTYLAAFVISNFEHISGEYRGITQRVYASPSSKVERGRKALKNVLRTVPALGDYFGIDYPLAKLDHVALKRVYGVAMENWGLITYKEDVIMHQEENDFHKILADVMAQNHEIAHQWFGNLVSPEWWSYAWMNEGFATYFAYVITDMLYPDYKVMEFFQTEVVEHAYGSNFITVRPMTHYVERESDIAGVFDIITYQKSASIVKMLHHAFNQKTFVLGINIFLRKFQYSVANEMQLADCLREALTADATLSTRSWVNSVLDILTTWTHNTRIPIVSVIRNYDENTITLRQCANDPQSLELWWIPLNFASESQPDFSNTIVDYFMPPVAQITLTAEELGIPLQSDDWLIVNKQQTGFYHLLYDEKNLLKIAKKLQTNHTAIHYLNRVALFQDLCPLIENNDIESANVIFELLKYLRYEQDLLPWNFASDIVSFLEHNLYGTVSQHLYKHFVRYLIEPTFKRLFQGTQPNNLTNNDIFLRQKILDIACTADLQECLDYTHSLTIAYLFNDEKFQNYLDYYLMNESIMCGGLRYLTDDEFDSVLELFAKCEHNSSLYYELVYALRCTQTREHLQKYLNVLFSEKFWEDVMYDKESMSHFSYVYKSNMAARPIMWQFIQENYKELCRSPYFVENFNRLAQYLPQRHRAEFAKIHGAILEELTSVNREMAEALISLDSQRIGDKLKLSEMFVEKFGQEIHTWLQNNQMSLVYAATMSGARNSSSRTGDILRSTRNHLLRFFRNMHIF